MTQNRYKVTFYKNNTKTVTMEKIASSVEEAVSLCIEKLSALNLSDMYDRHEVETFKVKEMWE